MAQLVLPSQLRGRVSMTRGRQALGFLGFQPGSSGGDTSTTDDGPSTTSQFLAEPTTIASIPQSLMTAPPAPRALAPARPAAEAFPTVPVVIAAVGVVGLILLLRSR